MQSIPSSLSVALSTAPVPVPGPAPDPKQYFAASPTQAAAPFITAHTALFLDFDGTLIDIAPHYDQVQIPPDLRQLLAQLFKQLNGAVAIVSGRSLFDLDAFLGPLKLPLAAEHGAVCRFADGQLATVTSPLVQEAIRVASALAAQHPTLREIGRAHV